jgi:hypothetical protein
MSLTSGVCERKQFMSNPVEIVTGASQAGKECMAMSQTMNIKVVTPAEIQWETGPAILPAGAQAAFLYGDLTKDEARTND